LQSRDPGRFLNPEIPGLENGSEIAIKFYIVIELIFGCGFTSTRSCGNTEKYQIE